MYCYEVRYYPDLNIPYFCGPQPDPEAAISHFNSQYAAKVGLAFTTEPTTDGCSGEYLLVEQDRGHDLREILLYEKK